MHAKKCLFLVLMVTLALSFSVTTCNAFYAISPDAIRIETSWEKDSQGLIFFTGTIQNVSDKELYMVSLRCNFYDSQGVQIGNGAVNISDIAINGIAKYKFIPYIPAETASAQITNVTVYAK